MDPSDAISANLFKWEPRPVPPPPPPPPDHHHHHHLPEPTEHLDHPRDLADVFSGYGVRGLTVARIAELGFTASTLAGMRDEELDDMMATLSHLFHCDLLIGEGYGIKAAIRTERRRIESMILLHHHHHLHAAGDQRRRLLLLSSSDHHANALDALSQEGLSEEPVQQEREAAGSGGEAGAAGRRYGKGKQLQQLQSSKKHSSKKKKKKNKKKRGGEEDVDEEGWDSSESGSSDSDACREVADRQREHPFIVTEPGEVARAKKNGLDYLFHLYEQCREFLQQVQVLAKESGHKCPTKREETCRRGDGGGVLRGVVKIMIEEGEKIWSRTGTGTGTGMVGCSFCPSFVLFRLNP